MLHTWLNWIVSRNIPRIHNLVIVGLYTFFIMLTDTSCNYGILLSEKLLRSSYLTESCSHPHFIAKNNEIFYLVLMFKIWSPIYSKSLWHLKFFVVGLIIVVKWTLKEKEILLISHSFCMDLEEFASYCSIYLKLLYNWTFNNTWYML